MKQVVSSIMLVIIMVLHLAPCSDAFAGSITRETVSNAASHHHQNKPDACNPFCFCGCCAVPSVVQAPLSSDPDLPFYPPVYAEYLPGEFIDVILPVWQPPQLSA